MTSLKSVVYVICLLLCKLAQVSLLSEPVGQEKQFISTSVGESITLQCFYETNVVARFHWYKQTLGQEPRLISTFYTYDTKGTFYEEFKDNPRFALDIGNGKHHLKISDLRYSDSANYYCAWKRSVAFEFGEGATVIVNGEGLNIHQSESETVHPGDSVALNCTVQTGTCDGEHGVYWFKDSGESHPGLVYTHGGRNDWCEKERETQRKTCVNLPMKSLNLSTLFYCAVASCGRVLFGNGTRLDVEDEKGSLLLVYFLSCALTLTITLSMLLGFILYMMKKGDDLPSTDSNGTFAASSTTNAEQRLNSEESLHYAPLDVNRINRSRRQRDDTEDECVYSRIKQ